MMMDQPRSLIDYIYVADLPVVMDILNVGKYETEVRQACLNALGNLGDERVLPVFLEVLEETGDLLVIEMVFAMRNLRKISTKSLVKFLEDCYKVKITSVRERVVEELFRMAWNSAAEEDRDPSDEQNSL